jgi:prefoldin subunit 5
MKEKVQIPVSEGQEPLSIENAKGQEHIRVPEGAKGPERPVTSEEVNLDLVNRPCIQGSEKEKETTHLEVQETEEESFMDLEWSMVFEQVTEIKKQRRELEQKKKELEQLRMQVDRARYDLENREVRILEVEYLIPIAKQLQQMGTDINQFLPWVETIHEKAQGENIPTLTKAAYSLAQDLRIYRQLGGLKKNIQLTTQQLQMLNMSLQKQQQAVMTLVNLQSAGISESEIVELVNFVGKWGKEWLGAISRIGGIANGFKFKLDDRLNV